MAEKNLKKLPIGRSAFSGFIQENCVYVDKTQYIYQMVTGGKYYFLSRPRRFGRSLFISTLGELFAGNKELFKGLWIDNSDYNWQEHPIICFDFSSISNENINALNTSIIGVIDNIALKYKVNITNVRLIKDKFADLIDKLSAINKVVILIDEYDKPILDHIDNQKEISAQCKVLTSFYSVIERSDHYLRFVALTGVSRFAKTSFFSGINNLLDISVDKRYATMFGYTQYELLDYFTPHIDQLAKECHKNRDDIVKKITDYYGGYQFAENSERVLSPFSIMLCLGAKNFGSHWFETGTPSFLFKLLQKKDYDLASITKPVVNKLNLDSFEPNNIHLSYLLFQTGYLTIKDYDPKTNNYILGIPNKEVSNALTINLSWAYKKLKSGSVKKSSFIFLAYFYLVFLLLEQCMA